MTKTFTMLCEARQYLLQGQADSLAVQRGGTPLLSRDPQSRLLLQAQCGLLLQRNGARRLLQLL